MQEHSSRSFPGTGHNGLLHSGESVTPNPSVISAPPSPYLTGAPLASAGRSSTVMVLSVSLSGEGMSS